MDVINFKIVSDEFGTASAVEMNGQDITKFVRGISLVSAANEMTVVGVEFIRSRIEIEGGAVLQQLVQNTGTLAAQAVRQIDWSLLEAEALANLDMGDSIVNVLMTKLVEMLDNGTKS
jgi:hypothetical protein